MSLEALLESPSAVVERSVNKKSRSAMTNGARRHLHPEGIDGRSTDARRFKDLIAGFAAPYGGEAVLTVAEQALVRNAAALTLKLEQMQADAVAGRPIDSAADAAGEQRGTHPGGPAERPRASDAPSRVGGC